MSGVRALGGYAWPLSDVAIVVDEDWETRRRGRLALSASARRRLRSRVEERSLLGVVDDIVVWVEAVCAGTAGGPDGPVAPLSDGERRRWLDLIAALPAAGDTGEAPAPARVGACARGWLRYGLSPGARFPRDPGQLTPAQAELIADRASETAEQLADAIDVPLCFGRRRRGD